MKSSINDRLLLSVPKNLTINQLGDIMDKGSWFFKFEGTNKKNFILDLSNIRKAHALGVLILYKLVEFSQKKHCFINPGMLVDKNSKSQVRKVLEEFGFSELIDRFVKNSPFSLNTIKIPTGKHLRLAPQIITKSDSVDKYALNNKETLKYIKDFYSSNPRAFELISLVFGEVSSNFKSHAQTDTETVLVIEAWEKKFEISCADTGDGIISTLKSNFPNTNGNIILEKSILKNITSKPKTNHMGMGLWLISNIVKEANGNLIIVSEGHCLELNPKKKQKTKKIGYWKGTIFFCSIPLTKEINLKKFYINKYIKLNIK